ASTPTRSSGGPTSVDAGSGPTTWGSRCTAPPPRPTSRAGGSGSADRVAAVCAHGGPARCAGPPHRGVAGRNGGLDGGNWPVTSSATVRLRLSKKDGGVWPSAIAHRCGIQVSVVAGRSAPPGPRRLRAVRRDGEPGAAHAVPGGLAELHVVLEVVQRPALEGELPALRPVDRTDQSLVDALLDLEVLALQERLPGVGAVVEARGLPGVLDVLVEAVDRAALVVDDKRAEAVQFGHLERRSRGLGGRGRAAGPGRVRTALRRVRAARRQGSHDAQPGDQRRDN